MAAITESEFPTTPAIDPWAMAVALNCPACMPLAGGGSMLVLRQAEINRRGALVRRAAMGYRLSVSSLRLVGTARISAIDFADDHKLAAFLAGLPMFDAAAPDAEADDGLPLLPGADGVWLPFDWKHRDREGGTLDLAVLPHPKLWAGTLEGWCLRAARRLSQLVDDNGSGRLRRMRTAAGLALIQVRMEAAVEEFTAALEPDLVRAIRRTPKPTWTLYDFGLAEGEETRRYRRTQAITIYPLLAEVIRGDDSVRAAVDEARPLNPMLRSHFGASAAALRRLVCLGIADMGADTVPRVDNILRALSCCPPEWHPRTPEQWRAFLSLLYVPDLVGRDAWPLDRIRELGPDWVRSQCRIGAFERLADIRDYRDGLLTHVLEAPFAGALEGWDAGRASETTRRVIDSLMHQLLDGRSLLDQLAASEQWHLHHNLLTDLVGSAERGRWLRWPALSDIYTARNGLRVVPLVNSGELSREGHAMGHCVAHYDWRCAYSPSHIIGVRSTDHERVSTAELHLAEEGKISVVQHRGPNNAPPSARAEDALGDYLEAIASGTVTVDYQELAADLARRQHHRSADCPRLGFDPTDRTVLARIYEIYRPLLPGRWRRMDIHAFHREAGIAMAIAEERQRFPAPHHPAAPVVPMPGRSDEERLMREWGVMAEENADPGMEEILASIRRILTEE